MYSQTLSSPVLAAPRAPAHVFAWAFTVFAMAAPILLVIYAFAISPDAAQRAQIVVNGLESTVFALVATLALRAFFGSGVKSKASRLVLEAQ